MKKFKIKDRVIFTGEGCGNGKQCVFCKPYIGKQFTIANISVLKYIQINNESGYVMDCVEKDLILIDPNLVCKKVFSK